MDARVSDLVNLRAAARRCRCLGHAAGRPDINIYLRLADEIVTIEAAAAAERAQREMLRNI